MSSLWFYEPVRLIICIDIFKIMAGYLHPRVFQNVSRRDTPISFFMEQLLQKESRWRAHVVWEYQVIVSYGTVKLLIIGSFEGEFAAEQGK